MLCIGLTGQSGAGKSIVASIMAQYKIPILDADNIYHDLLQSNTQMLNEIVLSFPLPDILENGKLNRRVLADEVFTHPKSLEKLNAVTHKYVVDEIRKKITALKENGQVACVIDAPQLFESGADALCAVVICVVADENVRKKRIMFRDGLNEKQTVKRMQAQKTDTFFRRHGDYVIENNTDGFCALQEQVKNILIKCGVIV